MGLAGLAWALLVLSPTQTKLAGLLWVIVCVWPIILAWRALSPIRSSTSTGKAAHGWLMACSITLGTWFLISVYWSEPCCKPSAELNAGLRLWLGALATYLWTRYWTPIATWKKRINQALALACMASLIIAIIMHRGQLPAYPIAWSAAMAMVLALLFPQALALPQDAPQRTWWLLCSAMGLAAVLLSQSRGSYLVMIWLVYLWGAASPSARAKVRPLQIAITATLAAAAIGLTAALPSDPLRMREGWNDWTTSRHSETQNTSIGARFALYELALKTIAESPWVGVGARERLDRIHTLGLDLPQQEADKLAHAREQGHVHNAFLHSAMDGGIISLVGFLASIGGLLYTAKALWHNHPIARQQMLGLAFVHASTSLSNVNLAHNYYVVMLSLCAMLVILQALSEDATTPGDN